MTDLMPGIADLGDGMTPVDIWQSLHAGERGWLARTDEAERRPFAAFIEGSDRQLMALLGGFPANRWAALCNGAGWTPIALAAFSWCEGAKLSELLGGWLRLGPQGEPRSGSAAQRAARFINPALLPANRLSALLGATTLPLGLAVLVHARPEAPVADVEASRYAKLDPALVNLIEALPAAGSQANLSTRIEQAQDTRALALRQAAEEEQVMRNFEQKRRRAALASALQAKIDARGWSKAEIEETIANGEPQPISSPLPGPALLRRHPRLARWLATDGAGTEVLHAGREEYVYRSAEHKNGEITSQASSLMSRQPVSQHIVDGPLETIYVKLLNEQVDVWRPAMARRLHANVFVVMPQIIPLIDENWEFFIAAHIVCAMRRYLEGEFLTAIGLAK